ncbi:MAG: M14 family zinc carboxypeptidase [candidate division KSB1 bacterium]|nr:M14 family zinc carboxypeptidase [candidate division KSB1 bacterium]
MRKSILVLLIQMMIIGSAMAGQQFTRKIVRIDLTGKPNQVVKELFQTGIDVTAIDPASHSVNALVIETELQNITRLGFKTELLLPDADAFARQLRQSGYFDHFHNYQQMLDEMQQVVAEHPDLAMLEDIGDSYEKTVGRGGYDIWALKISDNVQIEEDEAEVFFMANTHAREIITPEIILYFMHYLIDHYGKDGYVTYLVDNRQIWLCPTFNPDGHEYVFSGTSPSSYNDPMWWRKNKRDNNNNGVFDPDYDGVDLNRNFGYNWGYDNSGSSPFPSSQTYRGSGPFSEPESQAIRDFVSRHHFVINLSFHSYGQLWLYPWGYAPILTPDDAIFKVLADSCVAYNRYKPQPGYELYNTNGSTDDWFYGEQTTKNKVFGFTPEVGNTAESVAYSGFFPDTAFIQKQILENLGPMLYLTYVSGEPPLIQHRPLGDTESTGPYLITATIKPALVLTTPVPFDSASFKLFYNTTGVAPFDSVFLQPTGNPNEYQGLIPALSSANQIYYYLSASDQRGRVGLLPRSAPRPTFSFKVAADFEPPKIIPTPLEYASAFADQFPISAYVKDNIGISSVKLIYLKKSGKADTLTMNLTSIENLYQALIPAENFSVGDTVKYQLLATDNSANQNQTLLPSIGFLKFHLKNSLIFDFELEQILTPVTLGDWQWGIPSSGPKTAHSGVHLWATNLKGNYSDLTESILETPEISLMDRSAARLVFWHWYQNEYSDDTFWDGGNIKIAVDSGDFQVVVPEEGYDGVLDPFNTFLGSEPCFGGPAPNGNFWHHSVVDLSPFLNHTIKIRFHFGSDEAVNDLGWYIDDVEIDFEPPTELAFSNQSINQPRNFELRQNYPNPFNPTTTIRYYLAQAADVKLEVFDLRGAKVINLVSENLPAGWHIVTWDGKDHLGNNVASGIYFYRITATNKGSHQIATRKMVKLQ